MPFIAPTAPTQPPQRIVSLCPSITETLCDLGLSNRLVGRTRYCIHPANQVAAIADVGGTKAVDQARVAALAPDLIVSVKEENAEADIASLARHHPVLLLDPVDIDSALAALEALGQAVAAEVAMADMVQGIRQGFAALPRLPGISACYLIWRKPYMGVGQGTYIDDVLTRLGFNNIGASLAGRYPEISADVLQQQPPQHLLASSEPFPFTERYREELQALAPDAQVWFVDGEMFSWYGSRMLKACDYFRHFLHQLATEQGTSR